MKKSFFLLFSLVALAACSNQDTSQSTSRTASSSNSVTSSISNGKMDASQIAAPQIGLSDEEWNNSRGTVSDGQDTNSEQAPTRILSSDAKSIIIYFSRSGSTELLASKIQSLSGSDVIELVVDDTYSADYGETVERANTERGLKNSPKLNVEIPDLSQYQTVYLGYPIWGMTLAEPMATFVETYAKDLNGKTIVPFTTNGGYGLGNSVDYIESILADSESGVEIKTAFAVEGNKVDQADDDLITWYQNLEN
ncbi:TPA: flavodoxin [Streptococcus suis]|uniref:flavodoxin n=1 Tax=Streptococcus suis TaxID=1307 RepID=UPI00209AC68A|nr:flavodoxin [Streptococcus suis]MCO8174371.1 flavodoxin [Streptococcus suis]MCO8208771.1 flavodoxin [Streptococcus suis]HEM3488808.1 flavodoxin [Streptococcus suis]HEM3506800.1 flavodoxin [Streptococcus suis]